MTLKLKASRTAVVRGATQVVLSKLILISASS